MKKNIIVLLIMSIMCVSGCSAKTEAVELGDSIGLPETTQVQEEPAPETGSTETPVSVDTYTVKITKATSNSYCGAGSVAEEITEDTLAPADDTSVSVSTDGAVDTPVSGSIDQAAVAPVSGSIDGAAVARDALQYFGLPYVYGGESLTSGADCSGFTRAVYLKYGISLPHRAAEQANCGTPISAAEALPGDLCVYVIGDGSGYYSGHCGIYLGNGTVLQADPGFGMVCYDISFDYSFRRLFDNAASEQCVADYNPDELAPYIGDVYEDDEYEYEEYEDVEYEDDVYDDSDYEDGYVIIGEDIELTD